MDVLASRLLLHPRDPAASRHFYRDVLGLAVSREYGARDDPGVVFFAGGGFVEVAGRGEGPVGPGVGLWLQVRDVPAEHARLVAAGVEVLRGPVQEPWGLVELTVADPDGMRVVLVQVPDEHPLRRDQRG